MCAKPFKLSVKALVYDKDGRCLFIKRSMESRFFAGEWDLPGGKMDPGEEIEQALARETLEETGLTVAFDAVAGASECELPAIRVAILYLEAHVLSGKVRMSDEHDAFRWVPPAELATLPVAGLIRPFIEGHVKNASAGHARPGND